MLEKLKEYKELIAIISFFLGGFIWMQNQFPKMSDFETMDCRLEKYMTLMQRQIRGQNLEKEIQDLDKQIKTILGGGSGPALSPAMAVEFEGLKADLTGKKKELGETKDSMQKITEELQRQVCKKGTT